MGDDFKHDFNAVARSSDTAALEGVEPSHRELHTQLKEVIESLAGLRSEKRASDEHIQQQFNSIRKEIGAVRGEINSVKTTGDRIDAKLRTIGGVATL